MAMSSLLDMQDRWVGNSNYWFQIIFKFTSFKSSYYIRIKTGVYYPECAII